MDRRRFLKGMLASGFAAVTGGLSLNKAFAGTSFSGKHALASNSAEEVGLCLNIMYDTSGSVTNAAYDVQIEGIARTIESDDFRNAIFFHGGPESIALLITEFDTNSRTRVPWVDIRRDEEYKFQILADEIRNLKRLSSSSTHQVKALVFCANEMDHCPWQAERKAIAFMTDGKENGSGFFPGTREERVEAAIDMLARDHEISVSSLSILHPWFPDLDKWCEKHFYTRPGYMNSNGRPLDSGLSALVASSLDNETVSYYNKTLLAMRSIIRMDVAQAPVSQPRTVITGYGR